MDTNDQPAEPDFFRQEPEQAMPETKSTPEVTDSISWSASEFMHHQKSANWYLAAIAIIAIGAAVLFLLSSDPIGPIAVVILGALMLVAAGRKPRTIEYVVDVDGIAVGNKEYAYDDFQSFSVIKEDQVECIVIYPQKRFAPEITMYFAPDDGQKIFNILSSFLPFEEREKDSIDKFLHKIRF
jgi:hypothetical protein